MEFGTIEREIYVEASPEVVFEVVSSPDHLSSGGRTRRTTTRRPGAAGEHRLRRPRTPAGRWSQFTVVEASRRGRSRSAGRIRSMKSPRGGQLAARHLRPHPVAAAARCCKMTETGFREMGWEVAVLEQQYQEHVTGWDFYPAAAGAVRRDAGGAAVTTAVADASTTTSGRRSATRPGGGCSTCCCDGDGTATTLSEQLPVTRQAVAKHLDVLDRVGAGARSTPAGREKRYRVDEAQLARAVAQLTSVGAAWDARLQRIKRIAEAIQRAKTERRTATTHDQRTTEQRRRTNGGHSAPGRRRDPTPERSTRRSRRSTVWPAGGPTTRPASRLGGVIEFRFPPGGFDMEVVDRRPSSR